MLVPVSRAAIGRGRIKRCGNACRQLARQGI